MLDIINKDDYKADSVHKNLVIELDDGTTIDNKNIKSESMKLNEILMDEMQLKFGRCNSSQFTITLASVAANIKDREIKPRIEIGDNVLPLGVFTVKEVPRLSQTPYKQITALDNMHKIDRDVTEWYNNLTFPMTQKAFRDSFFAYIGLEQIETTLLFDDLVLNNPFADAGQINGRTIAEGLCELNATFGHCDRAGKFEYVTLKYDNLYPAEDLYPSDNVYPGMLEYPSDTDEVIENLTNLYIKASYEEYETQFIDRIIVVDDAGTQLANSDDSTANTYVINNNYLLYGREKAELIDIMNRFIAVVRTYSYRPASIENKGLPYIELGDRVRVNVKDDEILTYVFNRTLSGIQALRDTYSADGEEYLINDLNSIQVKMDSLNRRTDKLKIEVTATAKGLESKVNKGEFQTYQQQTATEISSKVSKGSVVSEINQSAEEVKIQADKIALEGTVTANGNTKINENGTLEAVSGKFSGDITSEGEIKLVQSDVDMETVLKTEEHTITSPYYEWNDNNGTLTLSSAIATKFLFTILNELGMYINGLSYINSIYSGFVHSKEMQTELLKALDAYFQSITSNSITIRKDKAPYLYFDDNTDTWFLHRWLSSSNENIKYFGLYDAAKAKNAIYYTGGSEGNGNLINSVGTFQDKDGNKLSDFATYATEDTSEVDNAYAKGTVMWTRYGKIVIVSIQSMIFKANSTSNAEHVILSGLPKARRAEATVIASMTENTKGVRVGIDGGDTNLCVWYQAIGSADLGGYNGQLVYFTD